jgi:DDE_Tnp_1-associated/Transposase DDE domain
MSPVSLVECFASVPDPRRHRSAIYPLPALLGLVTLGLLLGRKSLAAFRRLHKDYGDGLLFALGFGRARVPSKSSFSRLLRRLDAQAVEAALTRWVGSRLPGGIDHLSLDGKTLRGSKDEGLPGQHLVSAYAPQAQAVLAQMRVDSKTNEHKAALRLLGILPLAGKVVVGDAMFCQRDVVKAVVEAGGDYVFIVKDNQPGLGADVAAGFGHEAAARSIAAAFSP